MQFLLTLFVAIITTFIIITCITREQTGHYFLGTRLKLRAFLFNFIDYHITMDFEDLIYEKLKETSGYNEVGIFNSNGYSICFEKNTFTIDIRNHAHYHTFTIYCNNKNFMKTLFYVYNIFSKSDIKYFENFIKDVELRKKMMRDINIK